MGPVYREVRRVELKIDEVQSQTPEQPVEARAAQQSVKALGDGSSFGDGTRPAELLQAETGCKECASTFDDKAEVLGHGSSGTVKDALNNTGQKNDTESIANAEEGVAEQSVEAPDVGGGFGVVMRPVEPLPPDTGCFEDKYTWDDKAEALGEGLSGKVRVASNKKTGEKVAVKAIVKEHPYDVDYQLEIDMFQELERPDRHPALMKMLDHYDGDKETAYLVFPLGVGGNLCDRQYAQPSEAFSEVEVYMIMKVIIGAICYLHSCGICHGDIKLENVICMTLDPIGITLLKLIDFGASWKFIRGVKYPGRPVTTHFPPESWPWGYYDYTMDLWALGTMMWMMLGPDALPKLMSERNISQAAVSMISGLLHKDPSQRFEASLCMEMVEHLVSSRFEVDDLVEVKPCVEEPQRIWEGLGVTHGWVGRIVDIREDGELEIDFDREEETVECSAHPAYIQPAGGGHLRIGEDH